MSLRTDRPTRRVSFPVLAGGVALVTWLLLRIALWISVGPGQVGAVQSLEAFGLGLWFDALTLAFVVAPFLLVSALVPDRLRGPVSRALRWVLLLVVVALLYFGATAEFTFWKEFTTRFNFIAVDYLIYTNEVIGNVEQSYPMGLIFGGLGAASLLTVFGLSRFFSFREGPTSKGRRAIALALAVMLPAAAWFAGDVDQMQATGNAYADELAGNGIFTLAAAMRRNELDYDRFYRTMPQEEADRVLASVGVRRAPLADQAVAPALRTAELGPFTRRPKNVVLISVESLSASYLGSYGNKRNLTPNLDRMAAEGLKFDRMFATGTRTVRGLEALSLGTPPVPGQAIVRRPGNEHLATLGEALQHHGYSTYFVYGGYGYFDNMNAYFAGNDYDVVDRTDFRRDTIFFENIWGVADETLFQNAIETLDKADAGKPFFAHIMTTSNHRPFTYPDGRIDIKSPGGRKGAVKYTDWAIGQFIEAAKSKPWFNDTLFVVVADHCASVAGQTRLPVKNYRIPLILWAPGMLPAGTNERVASQVDLAPTLLDVLGVGGSDQFFGQSLFGAGPERAFVSNYQELGYYKNDKLTVLAPRGHVESFSIDPKTFQATPAPVDPALVNEAVAYYQTASRAFRQGALRSPDHGGGGGLPTAANE